MPAYEAKHNIVGLFKRVTVTRSAACFVGATFAAAISVTGVTAPAAAEVQAVATIKPVHSLLAAVMQGRGAPRLLIDGAGSPHTYALKPSDAKALSGARLVVRASAGLEGFLDRTLKGLPATTRVVALDQLPGVSLLNIREGGPFEAHGHAGKAGHDHGHNHGKSKAKSAASVDGHVWLDPDNARAIADGLAAVLAEIDPAGATIYRDNATRMKAGIAALAIEIAASVKPVADRPVVVFHDAYQYFERRFGLRVVGSITVSPDIQPSAKRLTELRRRITGPGATCVFAEPQFEPALVRTVTEGTKARPGVLDPIGAAIPAGPELYATLLRNLARDLKACLDAG